MIFEFNAIKVGDIRSM